MSQWIDDLLTKARAAPFPFEVAYDYIAAADPPTVERLCTLVLEAETLLGERRPGSGWHDTMWQYDADDWLAKLRDGG